jgi:hypothetical protein
VKLMEERLEREEVCSSLAVLRHLRWFSGRRRGRVEEEGELGLDVLFGWYGIDERVSERARGDLGSVFKKAERGRAHSHEQQGSPFIGQHGRRSGQAVSDKYAGLGCARWVARSRRGGWQEGKVEGGWSARRGDDELAHTRCLTPLRPSDRGQFQP